MIPTRFDYAAPASAQEGVRLLAERPPAVRVLGGGTWLVPELSRGEARPALVVDLRRAGLGAIDDDGDRVRIGAMATYADLLASATVARRLPLLHLMAAGVTGGWAIRNQGTVGGSVAAARPQSDAPAALVASGARAMVAGPAGERSLPVGELLAGAMLSGLAPDEILTGFDVPAADGVGHGYVKLKRGAGSWPIATAAALVALDAEGRCTRATLVLGGVTATPLAVDVSALVGAAPVAEAVAAAAQRAGAAVVEPWSDALAPGSYRAAVAAPVARRSLTMACENARRGAHPDGPDPDAQR